MDHPKTSLDTPQPVGLWRWTLSFLLVGICWGLTTPFMRRAALRQQTQQPRPSTPSKLPYPLAALSSAIAGLLQNPSYTIPWLLNVSGGVWFFLLVGQAELSMTVPITNSLAFLFTVLGEWWAEGKVVSSRTWLGMTLVLAGIALCVYSKATTSPLG